MTDDNARSVDPSDSLAHELYLALLKKLPAMLRKVQDILRAQGVSGLVDRAMAYAYRRGLRPLIPRHSVRYAGIPICCDRIWSDRFIPKTWISHDELQEDQPGYEAALVAGLNESVVPGDRVVIVGVGVGVTAVVAALRAGPLGTVECFEASEQYVGIARKTVARNKATNVNIHHAIIEKSIFVYGTGSDLGPIMPASQLPPCDVLQLDCEGAELNILHEMNIQPRVILVETHGLFGAPTDLVAFKLQKRGYMISDKGPAEPDPSCHCIKNDIRVLLGTKNSSLEI
jgi:hypothetical protein